MYKLSLHKNNALKRLKTIQIKTEEEEKTEKLLSDIENILERNLLMRDEDSETVKEIIELFKNSDRTQLKWHFKNKTI